ncbi:MAG TPA: ATP-binding cassette domain-containing protein, partial [Thermoanaerobaculia bacterium]|nr:ATP-binding cassette domain-containing protein [Thermoanaerobaculia bacterium]
FIEPSAGHVRLAGQDVTLLPPWKRNAGMVFQSYALFPHMTVAQNVAFGLEMRKLPRADVARRVEEALSLVRLSGFGTRLPRQLSGGQQQRVALARALAHGPEVLLLDEPFGALDARIRLELRGTIRQIQREVGITTLFVTHDQEEAFELADRLGVMSFGRLLETGPPRELYLRPETEFVATFLGSANLLVGSSTPGGLRVGPVDFPHPTLTADGGESRRVQVLFRPEDVALEPSAEAIGAPVLGQGVVESGSFVGAFERLRLRLPALPGVRAIAPAVPFGGDYLLVEASRTQHQARRLPLAPGDSTWVGVRRVHALAHPGLSFLLFGDGSPASEPAVGFGAALGRLAHARVERLTYRAEDVAATVAFEAARRAPDLVVAPMPHDGLALAEAALAAGGHHLLLVPGAAETPKRLLICVAVGEPGKEDVDFAGRLARHLGAEATILTVLPAAEGTGMPRALAERFLAASARTLGRIGVPAKAAIRVGTPPEEITAELAEGRHDLLVLGAPLPQPDGRLRLTGPVARLLAAPATPVLIVRPRRGAV